VCFRERTWHSAPLRTRRFEHRSRDIPSHRALDPRPRSPVTPRCLRDAPTSASLGQATAQRLLQLHYRRTDTLPSIRSSRSSGAPLSPLAPDLRSLLLDLLRAQRPSPVEEGLRVPRAASVPPEPVVQRCKRAAKRISKVIDRPGRRLRATPRSDHRLRRWPLADNAELRGPSRPERRTHLTPPAAAERRDGEFPSSCELLEHPLFRRRTFDRWAGCSHRSLQSTKAFVPAPPREGQRLPRKPGCLPPSGIRGRGDRSPLRTDRCHP